jgi:hypothetical protein
MNFPVTRLISNKHVFTIACRPHAALSGLGKGVFEPDPEIRCELNNLDSLLGSRSVSPVKGSNPVWPMGASRPSFSIYKPPMPGGPAAPTPDRPANAVWTPQMPSSRTDDDDDYEKQQQIRAQRVREEFLIAQQRDREHLFEFSSLLSQFSFISIALDLCSTLIFIRK